jgi:adenylate cyclase
VDRSRHLLDKRLNSFGSGGQGVDQNVNLRHDPLLLRSRRAGGIDSAFGQHYKFFLMQVAALVNTNAQDSAFEYEIPLKDAMELFHDEQGHRKFLVKKRYALKIKDHTWEIDNFLGDLAGLVIAEIELSDPDEEFDHPTWLGEEISSNPKYANANMWKNLK